MTDVVCDQGTAASTKNKLPTLITSMETIGAKALEEFADSIKVRRSGLVTDQPIINTALTPPPSVLLHRTTQTKSTTCPKMEPSTS